MATYNGHKNYNHWNVNLWLNNDERLYSIVKACVELTPTKDEATNLIHNCFAQWGIAETPDGVRYTKTAIRAAIANW